MTQANRSAFDDIIVAPATAAGASGVAVYRVSGADLSPVIKALQLPAPLKPRHAKLCSLRDGNASLIDEALAIYFPAPHSFTGEDVLELHTHGGSAIRRALLEALTALPGCRLAEPGEFSRRAFTHGKMDLLKAEAIADLINAKTSLQHGLALAQYGGEMSARFEVLRTRIIHALALLEAYIDFPDEEIPEGTLREVETDVNDTRQQIQSLLDEPPVGEMIRDGVTVAIIGAPNVGKSSLLNRLAQRDVAIVSDIAGTTRDTIEIHLNLGGYLVRLIDTAGLRESEDVIEQEGIRRAHLAAAEADITLKLFDIVSDTKQFEMDADDDTLIVYNKCDQPHDFHTNQSSLPAPILISAKSGEGVDHLLTRIASMIERKMAACPSPSLTRARHRDALRAALDAICRFDKALPLELNAEELRHTARAIGKITGQIDVDDLLDVVFKEFCIGK